MKYGQAFIGILLEVNTENFVQVRDLVKEWNAEHKRVLESGESFGVEPTMLVSVFLEPNTPVLVLAELTDKLEPFALPDTLRVSRGQASTLQEISP